MDDAIARLGLTNQALLVVTSDHGESLGEHGELLHGFFVYQSTLSVPWIARGPGIQPGTRLSTTMRLVDVFPTVLDLLNVASPRTARLDGRSVAPTLHEGAARKAPEETVTYAETLVPSLHFGWSDLRMLREGRWKYIRAPKPELYDLSNDPGELHNLVDAQPSRTLAMRSGLTQVLATERVAVREHEETVRPDLLERLGALGYVSGTGRQVSNEATADDPKDKIREFRAASELIREGIQRLHAREYPASAAAFERVLQLGVQGFEVHLFLARALAAMGQPREAAAHFALAVRTAPSQLEAWEGAADSLAASGDKTGALKALEQGERALPEAGSLRIRQARLLRELGRLDEARQCYEQTLPLAPHDAAARSELGEVLRDLGNPDAAITHLHEAVAIDPTCAECWNSLAATLGGVRRFDEAERAFRNAAARAPDNQYYTYNLGALLLEEGRADEARGWFEKSLAADPGFTPARQRLAKLPRSAKRFR
jgi:choline-sulfatase